MSTEAVELHPYSKKQAFVRLLDTAQRSKWHKILGEIGAVSVDSDRDPGWLLSKDRIDLFEEAVERYGSIRRYKRSRGRPKKYESPEPEERKGSRFRKRDKEDHGHERDSRERKHSGDSREEESESSGSDDELIQVTLARRLRNESGQKVDPEEAIGDSDVEDVISLSRRLRHVYAICKAQRAQIQALEERLKGETGVGV
jgi:hypothetical protein